MLKFDITDRAQAMITSFALDYGYSETPTIRIEVIGGADSGLAYDLFFDTHHDGDYIINCGDFSILIASDSASYLAGASIDWVVCDNGAGFYIENPNEPKKTRI
ncbi:MAG: iron-sulfur cluster assembly accessory protein [Candidatus Thiodiazotropha endolucinida]